MEYYDNVNIHINRDKCNLIANIPKGSIAIGAQRRKRDEKFTLEFNDGQILLPLKANENFKYFGNQLGTHRAGISTLFKDNVVRYENQI